MVTSSCFSLVSLYGTFLRRSITAAGLSSQTVEIDGDTTIHFWGPTSPTSKPPLILLHGFGPESIWQWSSQVSFFAKDFDLYAPDLVFFGDSFTNSSERSEVFQACCVAKLLEKLEISRYSLAGTSYGGFVAYHIASMWPERVEKVVIASSGVNMLPNDNRELLKKANAEKIEDLMMPANAGQLRRLLGFCLYRPPYIPDCFLNDYLTQLLSENRKEKLELLKAVTIGLDDTVTISPLPQEVLIVWGEHDQIFRLERAIELHKLIGEKARLEVITKTSHIPQLENAAKFNNVVRNFLHGSS